MSRESKGREAVSLALVAASWGLMAWYWPRLPAIVPTHWGLDGQPNGWMPMPWGALVGPVLTCFLYLVGLAVPRLDPRMQHWESSLEVPAMLRMVLTAFGVFMTYTVLEGAARPDRALEPGALWVGLGLMLVAVGNYMPKLRTNFMMGIRTPWTLANPEVWYGTHRFGGRLIMACGLVVVSAAALPRAWGMGVALGALVLAAVGSTAYSYWLYRRLERQAH